MSLPITLCLFTSTLGHFGRTDTYLKTINHLDKAMGLSSFAGLVAHIKVSPGEDSIALNMEAELWVKGFTVIKTVEAWSHHHASHQSGYLRDLSTVYQRSDVLNTPYVLHAEDDWALCPLDGSYLIKWFNVAVNLLTYTPDILQVRFPRFVNEAERIRGLMAKHGIDGRATGLDDIKTHFRCNDFSLNPSIFRGRDLRAALILMALAPNQFDQHVENNGFGKALKLFGLSDAPLAVLNPALIKAAHLGTRRGEEDSYTEPLMAT